MSLGRKLAIIIVLKLAFLVWVKQTYFSTPVDLNAPDSSLSNHLFNLSQSDEVTTDD